MRRISNQFITATSACLALVGSVAARDDGRRDSKPNIIVIFTDDQSYRAIGYEDRSVKTPHLDSLAASGITFERAYVSSPICVASRASMMTGLYPQQNGVIALNKKPFSRFRNHGSEAEQTLPKRLKEAGYTTAFFGKSHLDDPKTYGFDTGAEIPEHDDIETFRQASAFIKSRKNPDQPFFLWLAPHQPHVPLLPKQKWLDIYPPGSIELPGNYRTEPTNDSINNQGTPGHTAYRDSNYRNNVGDLPAGPPRDEETMLAFTRAYYAVVSHLDDQVGTFSELLEDSGLMENTVVIFLSDNGYHLGSHGLGNKITMHEESVRVPMFAFGAGIEPGKKTRELVSSLDVYPTVLELAGATEPPKPVPGKSLLPLIQDPDTSLRDTVFSECVGVGGKPGEGHRMARSDRWKLILSGTGEEYLFDQKNDPLEQNNRVGDPELEPILKNLRKELSQWMESSGDRPSVKPYKP